MREFLYSEISQIENLSNIPEDPELAIASGKNLCEKVLELIQQQHSEFAYSNAANYTTAGQNGERVDRALDNQY